MRLKTLFLTMTLALACAAFSQDNFKPTWDDSHSLINNEVAAKLNIEDADTLIKMATDDFEGMFKSGLLNTERCSLFQINDHADFCDYLYGYWDMSFATARPGSMKADLETKADDKAERAWSNALACIKIQEELSTNPRYDKESGIMAIKEQLATLKSCDVVRDNSPKIRLLLPDRVAFLTKYLNTH